MENIKNDKIHKCSKCGVGLIKPDVVFFGEGLPESYFHNIDKIK
jgi:NAD-dependent SIR2 family protein deacetylase